jgi:hypothetical protein
MSDYFDALMRTSGLSGGSSRPAAASISPGPATTPEDHGIQEIEEQRVVPAAPPLSVLPPRAPGRGAAPGEAPATAARRDPEERTPDPPLTRPEAPGRPVPLPNQPEPPHPSALAGERTGDRAGPERFPQLQPVQPVQPVQPEPPSAHPASGPARLQAALHWIAAGERLGDTGVAAEPERAPLSAAAIPSPDAPRPGAEGPAGESPPARPGREAGVPAALPARVLEPRRPRPEPAREDVVAVSIGAIHLRLEASQPTVAVAPSAPVPPTAAAPAPATAGSALSRRVLWRI